MQYMLCRNRVRDYEKWRAVFNADADAHREAGLILANIWRESDHPDTVHFLFEVHSQPKAKAFVSAPEAGDQGRKAGVIDGDYRFLDPVSRY